jgi:hypothetical protein
VLVRERGFTQFFRHVAGSLGSVRRDATAGADGR